ncbi:MAG: hypothetical protein M1839_004813 [Geoglossum umbratile]|nr:MAG: hypothetical protein M1839_004813 [Geoglossum umbratile]
MDQRSMCVELGPVGDLDSTVGICSPPVAPPFRPDPSEYSEELDIFLDSSSFVDVYCSPGSRSGDWAGPVLLGPAAWAAPGSSGKEIRILSVPVPIPMLPVILMILSDAIDIRREAPAGWLPVGGCAGGAGMEMLAIAMPPSLVLGAAYAPFLLADDETVEADDKLCGAARDLIRSDGGGRAGMFTLADDWAGIVAALPEGDLPA